MEKLLSEVNLVCPECGSNDIYIVIGEGDSGQAVFAEDVFDDRDDAMCGCCHHKDQAACFLPSSSGDCQAIVLQSISIDEAAIAAKLAYESAEARWRARLAKGLGTECLIESTDIFDALSELDLPCSDAAEGRVEDALRCLGYYTKAAEALKSAKASS